MEKNEVWINRDKSFEADEPWQRLMLIREVNGDEVIFSPAKELIDGKVHFSPSAFQTDREFFKENCVIMGFGR